MAEDGTLDAAWSRRTTEVLNKTDLLAGVALGAFQAGVYATLVRIGYCGAQDAAGPGKLLDHSAATLADRWAADRRQIRQALQRQRAPAAATTLAEGLRLHEVEATLAAT